jgi:hypothetical protein
MWAPVSDLVDRNLISKGSVARWRRHQLVRGSAVSSYQEWKVKVVRNNKREEESDAS